MAICSLTLVMVALLPVMVLAVGLGVDYALFIGGVFVHSTDIEPRELDLARYTQGAHAVQNLT